jgi:ParB family chromosome partitioning protein
MEKEAKKLSRGPSSAKKVSVKDADVQALQDELTRKLGLQVEVICKKDGSGELRIHYTRPVELDGVLRKLRS